LAVAGACLVARSRMKPAELAARAPTSAVRRIRTAPDVSLEVLDWGGEANRPALVFLAGGGGTAPVFGDFAPQFTDSFHVVGITRRGFGASRASEPGDLDTRVQDISAVLDTLRLGAVVLAGHSIAGEEMTRFAELNAARCRALIYIDAAYDRSPAAL